MKLLVVVCANLLIVCVSSGATSSETESEHVNNKLIRAVQEDHLSDVRTFIQQGAEINAVDRKGWTPLRYAAANGFLDITKLLLDSGADYSAKDNTGYTAAHFASRHGHLDVLELLVSKGSDLHESNKDGWTALHLASWQGHLNVVEYLIAKGVNISPKTKSGTTPLHVSTQAGHLTVVKCLIEHGGDVNSTSKPGNTPVIIAAQFGHAGVLTYLLEKGGEINAANDDGWTALLHAYLRGDSDMVKFLIEKGANTNVETEAGNEPLHLTSQNGHLSLVKDLIDNGTDINVLNNDKRTALHLATWNAHLEVVQYLIENGIQIDARNKDGWTALLFSVWNGHLNITKLLLERGADINAETEGGQSALSMAEENDYPEIVDILSNHIKMNRPSYKACQLYTNSKIGERTLGEIAQSGEFPWMAALLYIDDFDYSSRVDCGGTIISEFYVLSAAHCIRAGRRPSIIRVGKLSLTDEYDKSAMNYHIKDIKQHEHWSPQLIKNDIALIEVRTKIKFTEYVIPACLHLDLDDLSADTPLIVTGWDRITAANKSLTKLCKTEMLSVGLDQCNTSYVEYNERAKYHSLENGISEDQYCAGDDPHGHSDHCQGNCGGPLQYFLSGSSLAQVIGVVSFRVRCDMQLPGVHTRVGHYIDWIESIVWPNGHE